MRRLFVMLAERESNSFVFYDFSKISQDMLDFINALSFRFLFVKNTKKPWKSTNYSFFI